MFCRLSILWVALACAFAPALPMLAAVLPEPAACCCPGDHCCGRPECPAPVSVRSDNGSVVGVAMVSRATLPRAAVRLTRTFFVFASPAKIVRAPRAATSSARAAAASVPLFTEHCSFLL
ncbi:MAG: hypothetical protein ABUL68_01530 [Pseudomonadota bacterium]